MCIGFSRIGHRARCFMAMFRVQASSKETFRTIAAGRMDHIG
jgi:hypothetical protein